MQKDKQEGLQGAFWLLGLDDEWVVLKKVVGEWVVSKGWLMNERWLMNGVVFNPIQSENSP